MHEPRVPIHDGPPLGCSQSPDIRTGTRLPRCSAGQNSPAGASGQSGGLGGVLDQLKGALGGAATPGSILSGGLGELVDRFKQSGHAETAESWVGTGPNRPVSPPQLEQAIGPEVSRQELLARLSRELPNAVDQYTPQGRLPTDADFSRS